MLQSYMQGYVVWHIIRSALQKFEASIVCEKYNIVYKMRGKKIQAHTQKIWSQTNLRFKQNKSKKMASNTTAM